MKSPLFILLVLFGTHFLLNGQSIFKNSQKGADLNFYLPDIQYNSNIPDPETFLGFQIGEWHVSHDQLKAYMQLLAESSDRIQLDEYGKTHEGRPLQLLTISSPDNLTNIENIRKEHLKAIREDHAGPIRADEPVIIYQGYSIHGNESSGSNAAMLVAYYLAAGSSEHLDSLLKYTVILLDPCYNPDGLQRFASWVNRNKSSLLNSDPNDMEFHEPWPGGRTNHYWFDLNRDWLLLTHPESEGRIRNFHKWKPNVLTDHHEMGTNSTFFFQPGVPTRTNPNTPSQNQELTGKIATYHAKALDEIGAMYYSRENFDDFYYGKGSTYPDINGGIGILFEQASSRGHLQQSQNGLLSFPFTIRNQVATSLSTQKAALGLRKDLLEYQRRFYLEARKMANKSEVKMYHLDFDRDIASLNRFGYILSQHDISSYVDTVDQSLYIRTNQDQFRLLNTMIERVTRFRDSVFYDVSAWTFPDAFNVKLEEIRQSGFKLPETCILFEENAPKQTRMHGDIASYAYIFEWNAFRSARAIQHLFDQGIKLMISQFSLSFPEQHYGILFNKGSIIIPIHQQVISASELYALMKEISKDCFLDVYALNSGYAENGISLGSPKIKPIQNKNVGMLTGDGTNAYDAGEIWFHFDSHLKKNLSKLDKDRLERINLDVYDILILPDGNHSDLSGSKAEKIKNWVRNGGTLICFKSSVSWAIQNGLSAAQLKPGVRNLPSEDYSYESRTEDRTIHLVGGAIVNTRLDLSHPMAFGYNNPEIAVFQKGNRFLEPTKNKLASPVRYSENGLLSGYMSNENIRNMAGSPAVLLDNQGKGLVICFNFNPLFRGYFWGSTKLFENALYFSTLIDPSSTE